jgi:nucleotidyltransferase/DNA polymerase involved in DNA repair
VVRIACIHLPSGAIQAAVRLAPHLGGRPLGIVIRGQARPTIGAVSRMAHAAGLRIGMTVVEARAICPELELVAEDQQSLGALYAGLADTVAELAHGRVQIDAGRGVLVELPPGARSTSFGERLHELAGQLGLVSRVGIADDVFTAWAATQAVPRTAVRCVPAGGAATFLAGLPLELLPLDPDVAHTLALLGVGRLGAFAQLPVPSVGRTWSAGTLDLQALARGDGPGRLASHAPRGTVREALAIAPAVADGEGLGFLLLPLAERVCVRLEGRKRVAQAMRLTVRSGAAGLAIDVELERGSSHARTWLDLFRARLGSAALALPAVGLELEVLRDTVAVEVTLDLFARAAARVNAAPSATPVSRARARRAGPVHAASAGASASRQPSAPSLFDLKAPACGLRPPPAKPSVPPVLKAPACGLRSPPAEPSAPREPDSPAARPGPAYGLRVLPMPTPEPGALQVVEPPEALASQGELASGAPARVVHQGAAHRVVHALGPTRLEAPWAQGDRVSRDYWEVSLDDGRRLWIFRDRVGGGLYLAGLLG